MSAAALPHHVGLDPWLQDTVRTLARAWLADMKKTSFDTFHGGRSQGNQGTQQHDRHQTDEHHGAEAVQSYPHGGYDPERDGVPPPFPAGRALWPRPVDRRHLKENREAMQDHDPPL